MSRWEMVRLGDLVKSSPKSKVKAGDGLKKGKYKFFTSSNIQTKFLDNFQYTNTSLIFGTGGSASVHYCETKFSTSTDCLVFFSTDKKLDLKTVFLYLSSNINLLEDGFKGAGLKHISKDYILNIPVPLPPLEVQKNIANELDAISALIAKRKDQIEKLDVLVKAKFVEMFGDPVVNPMGWEVSTIMEMCSSIVDCPHSTPKYTNENTGYMCLRSSALKKNQILWNKIEYITKLEFTDRTKRKKPEINDIVYSREGAILGIAAVINKDCNIALGQRLMLLSPNKNKCTSKFLCSAMNFKSFLTKALEKVGGSASPHINVADIKNFKMILPPINLQNDFADYVEKVEKTKDGMEKGLEKLELLYKERMQEYFG